jgi:hypothetical protein
VNRRREASETKGAPATTPRFLNSESNDSIEPMIFSMSMDFIALPSDFERPAHSSRQREREREQTHKVRQGEPARQQNTNPYQAPAPPLYHIVYCTLYYTHTPCPPVIVLETWPIRSSGCSWLAVASSRAESRV